MNDSPRILVLMTGLPVTTGHIDLVYFARRLLATVEGQNVVVLLNSRECEPIRGKTRANALRNVFISDGYTTVIHSAADMPQNPSEHSDFWNVWKDHIHKRTAEYDQLIRPGDIVVASEEYGMKLAEVLECTFIPYDIKREMNTVSGTACREDMLTNFSSLAPLLQYEYCKRVTIFGAESCGKTTMAKRLAADIEGGGTFVPEWARGYLETVGSEITEEKMLTIVRAQTALQDMAVTHKRNKPFIIQDTDLLSTIGYYNIMGFEVPDELQWNFEDSFSNLYIVMNSQIPFESDPLRYGVDKRESTDQFWIDLLEKNNCRYHVVTNTDHELQYQEIRTVMLEMFNSQFPGLSTFVRT